MKLIAPSYYGEFQCIAGDCSHSCCIGWEIEIDRRTYESYQHIPGELGRRLAENVDVADGQASFRLGEEERCPFLNRAGLCDIILALGEGGLCQVCRDHPRFRSFYSGRTEVGLGLCCEAAGELILTYKGKAELLVLEEDGREEPLSPEEDRLLSIREKALGLVQDRSRSLDRRIGEMLKLFGLESFEFSSGRWVEIFRGMERLDPAWDSCLDRLLRGPCSPLPPEYNVPGEQLLVYFLYRHLPGALREGNLPQRAAFAALSYFMISSLWGMLEKPSTAELVNIARLYSGEIEYSQENMEALLAIL